MGGPGAIKLQLTTNGEGNDGDVIITSSTVLGLTSCEVPTVPCYTPRRVLYVLCNLPVKRTKA